jgi:hypothetical protein
MGLNAEKISDGSWCALCGEYYFFPNTDIENKSAGIYVEERPEVCKNCWDDYSGSPEAEIGTN